jgi:Ni,Fe-hydrogenase III large subunit
MSQSISVKMHNNEALDLADIPDVAFGEFKNELLSSVASGGRIVLLSGVPVEVMAGKEEEINGSAIRLVCVIAWDEEGMMKVSSTRVDKTYPSFTPDCPQAHLFEREIWEQWNIVPEGHPWLKPVRFHAPYRIANPKATPEIGNADFFQLHGDEVHEVAVGPVHAGVIEPGHFRFQCHGENVYHLEISLGYQHRGIERAIINAANKKRVMHYAETMAGDSTIAHSLACAQIIEALKSVAVTPRALSLRGIALELERLANHTGDLGALSGDVGFLPTASYCGRIRGDFLNMSALLCGSRFGRGMTVPGGVAFNVDEKRVLLLLERLANACNDVSGAIGLLFGAPSVMTRFENTGRISRQVCLDFGMVGVAARACGIRRDARSDFSSGIYNFVHIPAMVWESGDVFARAFVRWLEIQQSIEFIKSQLSLLSEGEIAVDTHVPQAGGKAVISLIEGWRGEVCHFAITGKDGNFTYYKVVDPSFHNWAGLAMALRGQQVSDFPLCNKSFNLSYCGHDL